MLAIKTKFSSYYSSYFPFPGHQHLRLALTIVTHRYTKLLIISTCVQEPVVFDPTTKKKKSKKSVAFDDGSGTIDVPGSPNGEDKTTAESHSMGRVVKILF